MARYNPALHRRRSIRLKGYDYSSPGLYFITICTHKRAHLFGEIRNGTMHLSAFGNIADSEWQRTAEIRPNVQLLEHIIMPNHMHGIIRLVELDDESGGTLQRAPTLEQFGKPTPNTIPTILRGYKAATTKQINTLRLLFRENNTFEKFGTGFFGITTYNRGTWIQNGDTLFMKYSGKKIRALEEKLLLTNGEIYRIAGDSLRATRYYLGYCLGFN